MKKQFKETALLTKVGEFMHLFSQDVLSVPTIPDEATTNLRVELIREELKELEEGIKNNNIIEVADALADLQYVLTGAIHAFGLGEIFTDIFNNVHDSNMSKACNSEEEALTTMREYTKQNIETDVVLRDDKALVYRKSDNKVLKNINYTPANLKSIIEEASIVDPEFELLPHQQRVVEEKEELDTKIEKLLNFITSDNPVYNTLAPEEKADMYMQSQQMMHYSDTLNRRIQRFTDV